MSIIGNGKGAAAMTDIVMRMKALPDLTNEQAWEVVYEGAREIERLRTALDRIAYCGAGEDYRVLRELARIALTS